MTKQSATSRNTDAVKPLDLKHGVPSSFPKQPRLVKFFEYYIKTDSVRESGLSAGYSESWIKNHSSAVLRKYSEYLVWMRAHVAQQVAKQISIELDPVMQEIARIAFANEYDYLVLEPGDGQGKKPHMRRKRLDELSREQMVAIKIFRRPNGNLDYVLRDKEGRLLDLGKHLGAFNEKIILEHRHSHLHMHFDLSKVPLEQLDQQERAFEEMLEKFGMGRVIDAQ